MSYPVYSDEYFMNEALKEAMKAYDMDEVPVGVVIVSRNIIIARSHNMTENLNDATAHAEMIAITSAENYLGSRYLKNCTMYVTLEPCLMCASATSWAQIDRIVFGTDDPRAGYRLVRGRVLHPVTAVTGGVLEKECNQLLTSFFRKKRKPTGSSDQS
jgi:tRNA(adenine34) deaminase